MIVSGWGGFPSQDAEVLEPTTVSGFSDCLTRSLIVRGQGRSYGDSANAPVVVQTDYLDHFIAFDPASGQLTAEAGVTLREILRLIVPHGWFLPVTPGTSYATLGGAVASDVHGKNHHVAGTFTQHVLKMTMLLGSGEVVPTSPTQLSDLFHATCGGMGLTGAILTVTVQLMPTRSTTIEQTTIKTSCLEEACEQFEANSSATYSVAWIDCLARGKRLGRGVLMLGEHAQEGELKFESGSGMSVPFYAPAWVLSKTVMRYFNTAYYTKAPRQSRTTVSLQSFFYPLDALGGWNKLYGKPGFVQYQFVLPKEDGLKNLRQILSLIADRGGGSFLAVLKQFGGVNANLLSFPLEGYTLALDFKMTPSLREFLQRLDSMVASMGGRIYLAKDALMTESMFKSTYSRWEEFEAVREKYDAIGQFASSQSRRLGLK